MKHHLRADKVDFWTRLIPAVWEDYQLERRHNALLGDASGCQAVLAQWVLGAVVVALATLLVGCVLLAARYHSQYRRLSLSIKQESVAKV